MNRTYLWRAALLAFGLLGLSRPAVLFAHAELVRADPPPGAVLANPPAEICLTFSEGLAPDSTFALFGAGFREVAGESPGVRADTPEQMCGAVPSLAAGTYTVQWRAVTTDGHAVSGSYAFSVAAGGDAVLSRAWWLGGSALLIAVGAGLLGRRFKRRSVRVG